MPRRALMGSACLFAAAGVVLAAIPERSGSPAVTAEHYESAERFFAWNMASFVRNADIPFGWIGDEDRFWYQRQLEKGHEFIVVEAQTGRRSAAFDHALVARDLSRAMGQPVDPLDLPFERFEFTDERGIRFDADGRRWRCIPQSGCTGVPRDDPPGWRLSPDGRWAVFSDGPNLRLRSLVDGVEKPLTHDGANRLAYGAIAGSNQVALDMYLAGSKAAPVVSWSPDSTRILVELLDERGVLDLPYVQHVPGGDEVRPRLINIPIALPGDKVKPHVSLFVIDVRTGVRTAMRAPPLPVLDATPLVKRQAWWSADGRSIFLVRQEEGRRSQSLLRLAADTGASRELIAESSDTYFNPAVGVIDRTLRAGVGVVALEDGKLIWPSERSGWAHLYLHDATGKALGPITAGSWRVREIVRVDERNGVVYFTAGGKLEGRNPYQRYLYAVRLDGSGLELLTPEDADHELKAGAFSASGRFFVSSFSRPDQPPRTVLRTRRGKLVAMVEQANLDRLNAGGFRMPEPFSVLAADGTTRLYGNLFRPSHFDPQRKYPVVEMLYPSPQSTMARPSFLGAVFAYNHSLSSQSMAELGFILVTLEGRGGPLRSKAFNDVSYGRMHAAGELEDHIAGIRELARRYPYMDLDRVGVYGNSSGGYGAARAILAHPDFYKVAVSSNGDHDKRGIVLSWGPTHQGPYPGPAWLEQPNSTLAGNLKGKLLIVASDMDDNVHPAHSFQLVDALIEANKDFDLLVLPNAVHELGETSPYFIRRRMDYFVRHLLGAEPPTGYEIRMPQ